MVNPGNIDSFLHLALALFLPVSVFKFLHFPLFFLFPFLSLSLPLCLPIDLLQTSCALISWGFFYYHWSSIPV